MDLMIALGGGAAGAFAIISPRLSVAFVGVAIATALVPPLSSSAICLARGEYSLASGAALLAFTNIVAIQVAGSAVMWLGGFRGNWQTTPAVVLCALAVILAIHFREVIGTKVYEASVRGALAKAATSHAGAYLTDARVEKVSGRARIVAVYRTPTPFTPEEVGALEPQLPLMPGTTGLELRVRSVPITIATKAGYMFSSDRSDHDRPQ
jgi:uncharacterized membrane protein